MQDEQLKLRIRELTEAIESICLGSIENVVIEAAINELKLNWEDHLDKYGLPFQILNYERKTYSDCRL